MISFIAGSLGDALLLTMLGLSVYVLAIFFQGYLQERLEEFNIELENTVAFVLNSLAQQMRVAPPRHRRTGAVAMQIIDAPPFASASEQAAWAGSKSCGQLSKLPTMPTPS